MPFELFYIYASDRSYGLDWIWVSIYVIIVDWIGLGHRVDGLDFIGLDLENWTHGQLWYRFYHKTLNRSRVPVLFTNRAPDTGV